jgi:hypothetical protein
MSFSKHGLMGCLGVLILSGPAFGGFTGFTAGNLVIDEVSSGSALTSSATQTSLVQYTTGGTFVNQLLMPTTSSGSNNALTNSGTATSEGALSLSANGQYLTLAGYDAPVGTAKVASSDTSSIARVVGLVDASGNINTSTLITDGYSGNNIRGAATVNGTSFYTAGATGSDGSSGEAGGTHLVALGSTGNSTQVSSIANTHNVEIVNGQVYASSISGSNVGINTVGTGLPTGTGNNTTLVTLNTPVGDVNPYGFVFLGNDLFVADSVAGILEYVTSNGGDSYSYVSTTGGYTGLTGLTGTIGANGDFVLYAVDPTQLVSFTFDSSGNSLGSSVLQTAAADTAFRGIAFAPSAASVPEPASVALTGLGALGMIAAALRRRNPQGH